MAKPQIRVVFLDIDDTLYSTSEFSATARTNAMEAMISQGLDLPVEHALAELNEVIAEFGSNYGNHYNQLLKRLPPECIPPGNTALLVAAAIAAYHDTKFRSLSPFEDVPEVLRRIRENTDLTLGVITEGLEVKQAEKLVRLGVERWLDRNAVFISDQIGISKPNEKLYQRACQFTGVKPREAMYVGDHPERDIAPAKSLGMVTVRHRWAGGKWAALDGTVEPDYEIESFRELIPILRDDLGFDDL